MDVSDIRELIESATQGGKIVTVTFIKRSNGEVRTMNGRPSDQISRGKTGQGMAYDPAAKNLMPFLDMTLYNKEANTFKLAGGGTLSDAQRDECAKRAYRMIDLESVTKVVGNGETLYEAPNASG